MKVYVTDDYFHDYRIEEEICRKAGLDLTVLHCATQEEILEKCQDAVGLLVNMAPIGRKVLQGLPLLKGVSRYGTGVDNVDLEAAADQGIEVLRVDNYCSQEAAEHTLALALALHRQVPQRNQLVRQGEWRVPHTRKIHSFSQMTFGILGLGNIGKALLSLCQSLGFKEILYTAKSEIEGGVSLEELFTQSDIVSVHIPLNEETRGLLDHYIPKMKKGSLLINTARGGLFSLETLEKALKEGILAGAALDVFPEEPPVLSPYLLDRQEVIFTDHQAYYSEESLSRLKRLTAENLVRFLTGDL